MNRVLVGGIIHQAAEAMLSARSDVEYEIIPAATAEQILDRIADVDGVLLRVTRFGADTIDKAGRLKVVSRFGVGYDNVDVPALTARGIPLTVIGEANSVPVAEHALMMMLAMSRQLVTGDREVRAGNWAARYDLRMSELSGKIVLIVGFGRIGARVARRCAAFDMTVVVADPFVAATVVEAQGYRHLENFHDGLADADFVTLHLPGNPDGTPVMGATEIKAMKENAYFINVARGSLVDEAALAEALSSGHLAGAGIDVFGEEPPHKDNPLLGLETAVFSPHDAALTAECIRRMSEVSVQNIFDAFDGRLDPSLVVNREVLD
jgi:D-3-phosphoglycerate dehydrogenase / 2-oxoglutarate reductase